ncbi:hypothetical protein [Amycolatopsis sp. WAC 01375]|uniref:hypothetical protein n=1 Tax=Amycolatopsis sp. WAC 01375 TaxID=2203194 RepID=UPI000F775795|nr:hypothetical protein [Amycolatopsis sp. WAC 01375]
MTHAMQAIETSLNEIENLSRSITTSIEALPRRLREEFARISSFNFPATIKNLDSAVTSTSELVREFRIAIAPASGDVFRYLTEDFELALASLVSELQPIDMLLSSLINMQHNLADLRLQNTALDSRIKKIRNHQKRAIEVLRETQSRLRSNGVISPDFNNFISSWTSLLQIEDIRSSVENAGEKVEQVLDASRKAAGQVAENSLSLHFKKVTDRERTIANKFRWIAVGLLALTGVANFYLTKVSPGVTAAIFDRLLFSVPALLLAAYFARESSKHRHVSHDAEQVEVRLLTIDAYVASLEQEAQDELRAEFGKQIFSVENTGTKDETGLGMLTELNSLLDRMMPRKPEA